jgi:site-specific recombinase XerD
MKGCRPLTDAEVARVLERLGQNRHPARDRALFLLGLKTGFRIRELLSLTLADVLQNGRLVDVVSVARRNMKKKREGRSVPLMNEQARAALDAWIAELAAGGRTAPETYLFRSREGANNALDRRTAWYLLKRAYAACGMTGKLATHTLRKTYAKQMKDALGGDLHALQKAMGHAQISSTMSYIEVDEEKLRDAYRKI